MGLVWNQRSPDKIVWWAAVVPSAVPVSLPLPFPAGAFSLMAGYSTTPLPRKLGIKPGARVLLVDSPDAFGVTLGELPEGVALSSASTDLQDIVLFFTASRAGLDSRFGALAAALRPAGSLWVAWPKQASGVPTDLNENVVREIGLAAGWVDIKVCAIDATWSGLRFVIPVKERPGRSG